jgi:hypothetical protein
MAQTATRRMTAQRFSRQILTNYRLASRAAVSVSPSTVRIESVHQDVLAAVEQLARAAHLRVVVTPCASIISGF